MGARPQLEGLQALRGLAALAVLLFHGSSILEERTGYLFAGGFFSPGSVGVDLFFVLSGFIIHHTAARSGSARQFFLRRFVRIFPVYWILTAALLAAYHLAPSAAMAHKADPSVVWRSLLLLPADRHVIGVAWTLVYEVWFYALFGLLYLRAPRLFYGVMGLWVALAWGNRWLLGWEPQGATALYLLRPLGVEFLLGCGASALCARARRPSPALAAALGAAGFAGAWAAVLARKPLLPDELAFGLSSALLVYGAAGLARPVPRLLRELGDASYSLYLLHGTAISALLKLAAAGGALAGLAGPLPAAAVFAAATAICWLFYRAVERPLLAQLRLRLAESSGRLSTWPASPPSSPAAPRSPAPSA